MSDAYLFLQTILPKVWGIIGAGVLLGLDEVAARYSPAAKRFLNRMPEEMRRVLEVSLLCGAIFYAGFTAWQEEHTQRLKLETELTEARAELHRTPPSAEKPSVSSSSRERMPNGDLLYQNGKAIGSVGRFLYEPTSHTVTFGSTSMTATIDFSKRILFRDGILHCAAKNPRELSFSDYRSLTYSDLRCDVSPLDAQLD